MYKDQKLKKCPKCGADEGLIACSNCWDPTMMANVIANLIDWNVYVGSHNTQESTGLSEGSKDTEDV